MTETRDAGRAAWALAVVCLSVLLASATWFSGTAAAPVLRQAWSLTDAQGAALTTSVQLGFIAGTLVYAAFNVSDVFPARRVFLVSALLGAAFNAGFAIEDAGLSNDAIRAFGESGTPVLGVCLGLQCIGELYGGSVVRAPHVMHGKTSEITPLGRGRVRGPARAVHGDALPLPRRRPRVGSRGARDHRRVRGRSRHGSAAPRASRSRACSSTPSRSSPTAGTSSWRTSSRGARRASDEACAPPRDLGETVVEQRREHLAVELAGGDAAGAQPRHHDAAALTERALEPRLAVLRLVDVGAARRADRDERAAIARGVHARRTPSRRDPSPRAAGRGRAAAPRSRSRTRPRLRGRRAASRARVRRRGGC